MNPSGAPPPSMSAYLVAHRSTITNVEVFGGTAAVSTAVRAEALSAS